MQFAKIGEILTMSRNDLVKLLDKLRVSFILNILIIAYMIDLLLSHTIPYLGRYPSNGDPLEWRIGESSDHVVIFVLVLGFSGLFLKLHWKGWKSFKQTLDCGILQMIGDVMQVYGWNMVIWGYVAGFLDVSRAPLHMNVVASILYYGANWPVISNLAFVVFGMWLTGINRRMLYYPLMLLPVYVIWALIGFPITLDSIGGRNVPTIFYSNVWVNGLEIFVWGWVCFAYILYWLKYQKPLLV